MDEPSAAWLTELGIDCYNMINDCHINSLDQHGGSLDDKLNNAHFPATGQMQQQALSSDRYSSLTSTAAKTTTNIITFKPNPIPHPVRFERATKLPKTNSWCSSTSTTSSPTPHILSFANPNASSPDSHNFYGSFSSINVKPKDEVVVSHGNIDLPTSLITRGSYDSQEYQLKASQGSNKRVTTMDRSPLVAQDHIIAERKRREKLSQRFIALSALVPGLKKMDKASVLGDAIKYLKQLQERAKTLEDQAKKRALESVVLVKKSQISIYDDDASSSSENSKETLEEMLPEIEARVSDKNVLIRIHCEKQQGLLVRILSEIEKLHLTVINSSALTFGNYDLVITIVAQMDEELSMTPKELVKKLRFAFQLD
ncbi:hypothetical protein Ancab_026180 [Ancistrocladus abbreviatus]